jgi:predicted benzoate:H+ symporter BenE
MKYVVIVAFIAIISSLAVALVHMMRGSAGGSDQKKSKRMARALAFRVGFSVLLFVGVMAAYWMGWIQPTGLPQR